MIHATGHSRPQTGKAIAPIMVALVDDNWGRLFQIREDRILEVYRLECVEDADGFRLHEPRGTLAPTRAAGPKAPPDQQALFYAAVITELLQCRRDAGFQAWWLAGPGRARRALLEECTPGLRSILRAELDLNVRADESEIWPAIQQGTTA